MTSYRFLNPDHSLAMRDDHVIPWNAKDDTPDGEAELALWQAAGSPKPEAPSARPFAPPGAHFEGEQPPWETDRPGPPLGPAPIEDPQAFMARSRALDEALKLLDEVERAHTGADDDVGKLATAIRAAIDFERPHGPPFEKAAERRLPPAPGARSEERPT